MKKITPDLQITGCEISIARMGVTVTFKFLGEYEATAWYLRQSSGNQWLETVGDDRAIHEAVTAEVEDNEEAILTWIEEQFANETDRVDPEILPNA